MENFNLKKFLVENKLTTNSKMMNEILKESLEDSDQERVNMRNNMRNNSILFKTFEAPEKITLQITNTGKEKIKSELENWIPQNERVPTRRPDIKDKVTLNRSLTNKDMRSRIGEISLDMGGREVPDFSKFTQDDEEIHGFNKIFGSTRFSVFAEYFPVASKGVLTATIGLTKGLERPSVKSTNNNLQKVNTCEFKKIEVGEVDDRGWFKIVSVN